MDQPIHIDVDFKGFSLLASGQSKSVDKVNGSATCALVRVIGEAQLGAPARVVWRIENMRLEGKAGSSLDTALLERLRSWFISHYGTHVAEKLYHVRNTQKEKADG